MIIQMKRLTALILAIGLASISYGQKYSTKDIRLKADSILGAFFGDTILRKYCTFDTVDTYYEYKNVFNRTHWERLYKYKRTKGKLVNVQARWHMSIPFPKCPEYNLLRSRIGFDLDPLLQLKEKPSFDFIPDVYWNGDSCNLINKQEALTIAKREKLKSGTEPLNMELYYDSKQKIFIWKLGQILSRKKDGYNHDYGEIDVILINASTGKVNSHETFYYGPVY